MIDFIKATLRKNPFYQKHLQTLINDLRYGYRDMRRYFRQYSISRVKNVRGNTVFLIFDPNMKHPGLADRFKIICCVYYIAKENDFDFKIIFEKDFEINKYLCPNQVDWKGDFCDLSYSIRESRLFSYNGGKTKLPKLNKAVHQYHVYNFIGLNIISRIYKDEIIAKEIWHRCYNDLFRPTSYFLSLISKFKIDGCYIAAHFRFVNALGHFEDGYYNELSKQDQEKLIDRCLAALRKLKEESSFPVVVFSDSDRFLNIAVSSGFLKIGGGNIGHVSCNHTALEKSLLDFYIMSDSVKIVRFLSKELYGTMFSYYAALINNREIETRYI